MAQPPTPATRIPASRRPARRPDAEWLAQYRALTRDNPYMDPLAELGVMYSRPTNTVVFGTNPDAIPRAVSQSRSEHDGFEQMGLTPHLQNPYVMAHEMRHAGMAALRQLVAEGHMGDEGVELMEPFSRGGRAEEYLVELADAPTKYGTREVPRGGLRGLFGGTTTETYNIPLEQYGQPIRDWVDAQGDAAIQYMQQAFSPEIRTSDDVAAIFYGEERDENDADQLSLHLARERVERLQALARRAPGMGM